VERRRHPAAIARLAGVALLVLTAATACSGSGPVGKPVAATVNGHDITTDALMDLLNANKRYARFLSRKSGQEGIDGKARLEATLGDGPGTFSTASAADALTQLISYQVVLQELARKGLKVTEEDLTAARKTAAEGVGGEAELKKFDKELVAFTIRSNASYAKFAASFEPSEADLRKLYEETKGRTPLCVSIIVAQDEAGGAAAKARVDGGDEFGTVAQEVSIDQQTAQQGGFVGCADPATVKSALGVDVGASPAVGDVFGPVSSQGAFVVLQVDSITGPTFEQARPGLEQQATGQDPADPAAADTSPGDAAAGRRFQQLLAKAKVTVNRRYGRWDAKTASVLPPKVEGTTTTTTTTPETIPVDPSAGPQETVPADPGAAPQETVPATTAPAGSAPATTAPAGSPSTTVPG
jgi:parvulin-like peptidyl-prolyl isomerase